MRHLPLHASAALVLCARLTGAQSTPAPSPLSLRWAAPADCPNADEVRRMALGGVAPQPGLRALEADAEVHSIERDGVRRYRVELRTRRGEERGERSIEAASCSGAAEATAIVLSLALTTPPGAEDEGAIPSASSVGAAASAASAPDEGAPTLASNIASATFETPASGAAEALADARAPASPNEDVLAPSPRAARATDQPGAGPHALAVGVSLSGDTVTLPSPAAAAGVSLAWHLGALRLELEARRWMPQSHRIDAYAAGARFSVTSLGARGCWATVAAEVFELGPCAGADVHMVSAPGRGVDPDYDATAEWTAFAAGVQGRWLSTSWLALRARLEASIPLARPIFVLEGAGNLHQPGALGVAGGIGAELLFF